MNSSPVIVLYSLQDKWSLKENLVWICYLFLSKLFVAVCFDVTPLGLGVIAFYLLFLTVLQLFTVWFERIQYNNRNFNLYYITLFKCSNKGHNMRNNKLISFLKVM